MTKRWYVVHTYSGYEKKVKTDLEHRIETMGMQDRIFDIEIPIERAVSARPRTSRFFRAMSSSAWRWMMTLGPVCATRRA